MTTYLPLSSLPVSFYALILIVRFHHFSPNTPIARWNTRVAKQCLESMPEFYIKAGTHFRLNAMLATKSCSCMSQTAPINWTLLSVDSLVVWSQRWNRCMQVRQGIWFIFHFSQHSEYRVVWISSAKAACWHFGWYTFDIYRVNSHAVSKTKLARFSPIFYFKMWLSTGYPSFRSLPRNPPETLAQSIWQA